MSDNMKNSCKQDCADNNIEREEQKSLRHNLDRIKHKIIVMSGKGGVGKSTVSVNLAISLAMAGKRVGLLDVDIHGPSIPTMLNLTQAKLGSENDRMKPVRIGDLLEVVSIGFLLRERDDAVIWRGPMKMNIIKQFLTDVEWGDLDYLVIDSPPGTGDEPLSVCQLIGDADGAVVVTTPQEVSAADVRKSIDFCMRLNLPVLGIVENMSGFVCPKCGELTDIFNTGAGQALADKFGLRLLGRIPLDPQICAAGDSGRPFVYHYSKTATAKAFETVVEPILNLGDNEKEHKNPDRNHKAMKIAIPLAEGKLCLHFGHCEQFVLVDVNESKQITAKSMETPPPHEPGVLPKWLAEKGVTRIIAGGMGQRAQQLFAENGISVHVGAAEAEPEQVVADFLSGTLKTGANSCDH